VVSSKGNEWGNNYWLACFTKRKMILNVSLIDSKGIYFMIGWMVNKREYLTLNETTQKEKGYLFEYYRLGHFV
jgi:hypothetical protein